MGQQSLTVVETTLIEVGHIGQAPGRRVIVLEAPAKAFEPLIHAVDISCRLFLRDDAFDDSVLPVSENNIQRQPRRPTPLVSRSGKAEVVGSTWLPRSFNDPPLGLMYCGTGRSVCVWVLMGIVKGLRGYYRLRLAFMNA